MAQEINFLKPKPAEDSLFYHQVHLLKVGSILLLVVYCLILAAATALSINIGQTKKTVAAEIQLKKEKIDELKKAESLQSILGQRLSSLAEFKKKDTVSYAVMINEVLKAAESGVMVDDVSIDEENLLVVEGSAPNSSILGGFLEGLSGDGSAFSQAILSSLTKEEDGTYVFTVNLKIKISKA